MQKVFGSRGSQKLPVSILLDFTNGLSTKVGEHNTDTGFKSFESNIQYKKPIKVVGFRVSA